MLMKLFYILVFLVVIIAGLTFGGENSETVTLDLILFALPAMPLFVLVFGGMAIGMIIGLIPSILSVPFLKLKLSAQNNRIKELEKNAID